MPRLATSLLRRAYTINPLLPLLLRPCRDLRSAQNELRWLREHVDRVARSRRRKGGTLDKASLMRDLVGQRARGVPLQYLLGTEWFGEVEVACRPGVLIPRQDTASSIQHLVHLLRSATSLPPELRVLDLCTGTGCIPLLFHHDFYSASSSSDPISATDLRILGVDISEKALNLASHNLARLRKQTDWIDRSAIAFLQADILLSPFADQSPGPLSLQAALNWAQHPQFWDILISNPPYISPSAYWKTTTRSVRGYEPKLALVPRSDTGDDTDVRIGDAFYHRLLNIARYAEAKIALLEVADLDQALRVAGRARKQQIYDGIEIWRDRPDRALESQEHVEVQGDGFPILGQGNVRSVLCYRGAGTQWLGKSVVENRAEGDAATLSRQEAHDLGVLNNFFRF